MPRIRLPKDWKLRATRAFRNLNEPGIGAACLWCGHPYRSGEYSPDTETAHLLECPEFPQEAKKRMREREGKKLSH